MLYNFVIDYVSYIRGGCCIGDCLIGVWFIDGCWVIIDCFCIGVGCCWVG